MPLHDGTPAFFRMFPTQANKTALKVQLQHLLVRFKRFLVQQYECLVLATASRGNNKTKKKKTVEAAAEVFCSCRRSLCRCDY